MNHIQTQTYNETIKNNETHEPGENISNAIMKTEIRKANEQKIIDLDNRMRLLNEVHDEIKIINEK